MYYKLLYYNLLIYCSEQSNKVFVKYIINYKQNNSK